MVDKSNEQSYTELKNTLINRLNKIEGQIRGIKKMMEEERDCLKVLEQVSSVRSSLDSVGLIIAGCAIQSKIKDQLEAGAPVDVVIAEAMKPFIKKQLFD